MPRLLDLESKLGIVCGIDREEARAICHRGTRLTGEEFLARTGLPAEVGEALFRAPESVMDLRLDPNQATPEQLTRIPGLSAEVASAVRLGRPYYTLEELRLATSLPYQLLRELFAVPTFSFWDPFSRQRVSFSPLPERYLVPAVETDFEQAGGFVEVIPPGATDGFRVIAPADFRAAPSPHELKARLGGNVHPVLQDGEGFTRYLLPGHFDLWFRKGASAQRREEVLASLPCTVRNSVPRVGYYRLQLTEVPADRNLTRRLFDLVETVQAHDDVLFAEPDQIGVDDFGPIRLLGARQDEFLAVDQRWNEDAIDLASAHALTRGSTRVTILLVDAGCRMDHEALQAGLRPDWPDHDLNFALGLPDEEASPAEEAVPHGTMVAGVASRVAPGCRILPLKVSGQPVAAAYGLRAAAIQQALDLVPPGERAVLNLSWRTNGEHIGIREALVEAQRRNVPVVAAAGNYGSPDGQRPDDVHYPSGHTWLYPQLSALCSVAAVTADDKKASYSYYGAQSISVSAPGGDSPLASGTAIYTASTPTPYAYTAGTSFAAPMVTGVLALLLSADPSLTARDAVRIVKETADPIDDVDPAFRGMLGSGRLNARRALERVMHDEVARRVHVVTASAGPNGTIIPMGEVSVAHGADQTFRIVPDPGFQVDVVLIDDRAGPATTALVLRDVTSDRMVLARFRATTTAGSGQQVNVNTASIGELAALPLIGTWLAHRIVQYRQTHGHFSTIWELSLAGIGSWVIRESAHLITV